ncbi:hypothetical protein ILP97_17280 [Amycolatopsis sp. H6(2020)]|nr:hypothetical protein [Amycolatopsis sp. H6(2020)]
MPIGLHAPRWVTVSPERAVLLIAHNVTTLNRLLDVIPAFENDCRVQLVFTDIGADPFRDGLADAIARTGIITIPWEQAKQTRFDLAISASHHGELTDITARRAILSHGIGYTKYSPRRAESGERRAESGERRAFGLSAEWLLRDGSPLADAFVLSHPDQVREIGEHAPAALPAAVVAGDPCLDRITASIPFRDRYRATLGIGERTLVLLTSTWSQHSLLGARPQLPREILAELSPDSFAVALILHPNITHGHGMAAVRQWYADCLRSGMLILDEVEGWRAGLVAADVVIGDHGSVTGYAAALGKPTLLGAFDDVPPATPISILGELAPRLAQHGPYRPDIIAAARPRPDHPFVPVQQLATSAPGEALSLLRKHFYSLLDLSEPNSEVAVVPIPAADIATRPPGVHAHFVSQQVNAESREVRLSRLAAEVQRADLDGDADVHLSCSVDYPIRSLRAAAAVLTARSEDTGEDPVGWHQRVFARHPSCVVSAVPVDGSIAVQLRDGPSLTLSAAGVPVEALASAVYAWIAAGLDGPTLAPSVLLSLDGRDRQVEVSVTS